MKTDIYKMKPHSSCSLLKRAFEYYFNLKSNCFNCEIPRNAIFHFKFSKKTMTIHFFITLITDHNTSLVCKYPRHCGTCFQQSWARQWFKARCQLTFLDNLSVIKKLLHSKWIKYFCRDLQMTTAGNKPVHWNVL